MLRLRRRSSVSRRRASALAIVIAVVLTASACVAVYWATSQIPTSTSTIDTEPTMKELAPPFRGQTPTDTILTIDDGFIPDGEMLSPFADDHPAVTNLSPALLDAIRNAAADAEADGVEIMLSSGWRSTRYQQILLDNAIVTYGSESEARKWVNTVERSSHVTGDAVDVGPEDAYVWLAQHGAAYGLCQTYTNEPWHYELVVRPGEVCPRPLSDATAG